MLLLCPLWLKAQFVSVDWSASRGDSLLPVCSSVVDLPGDYRNFSYSAHIEYPEYQKMTVSEVERYMLSTKYGVLPEQPEIECRVGIQAKRPQLDVVFLPVVMRGGNYYRLNSYKLVVDKVASGVSRARATRQASERYAANSVLAQGRWVRISVKENGIHKITDSELKNMGFQNPATVRLFGYGGHILPESGIENLSDDLQEIPLWRENGYVLFNANGVVKWKYNDGRFVHEQNVYSHYGCYFITEGGTPMLFPSEKLEAQTSSVITEYPDYAVIDNDKKSHCQYGRVLVDDYDYSNGRTVSYKFPISGVVKKNGVIDISFATNGSAKSDIELFVGGKSIGKYTVTANTSGEIGKLVEKKFNVADAISDNFSITVTQKVESSTVNGFLDYIRVNYIRKLALRGSQTAFRGITSLKNATFEIDGCNANTRVWDISSAIPRELKGTLAGNRYSVVAPSGVNNELIALNVKGEFPSVEVLGEISNQNLHAIERADMVIIIPSNGLFNSVAEKLANAHREMENLVVEVVTAQQLYNEFSSGTPDVTAYRRFMKMLYDRAATAQDAPKYLLMMGDSWYDNRLITFPKLKQDDYLLCYESLNSVDAVRAYVLEDYMGFLDDGEGANHKLDKVDIGVGRIPTTSVVTVNAVVDKTISYMKNGEAGEWQNVVALLGDDGDEHQHMKDAEGVAEVMNKNYPSYILDRIYWDDFVAEKTASGLRYAEVTNAIESRLDKGALVVNYSGHGSTNLLSHEMAWKASDMAALKSPRLPFWVTASCDIGPFDKGENSIAETALMNAKGGAVGLFTTTRTVLQYYNAVLNKEFMKALLSPVNGGDAVAVGDAVRKAKCNVISFGTDVSENKLQYVLLGDPALRLKLPEYRIKVEKVNGLDAGASVQASAGGILTVEGRVVKRDGTPVDDFKGLLYATMFDCAEDVTTLNNAGAQSTFEYTAYKKTLFSGSDSVLNGCFEIKMPVPMDISYSDEAGLLTLFAVNSEKTHSAQGNFTDFTVGGTASEMNNDGRGPEIKLYLNTPSFVSGDKVNSTPCLCVELFDENGINTVGAGIGHGIVAIVDNNPVHTYNLNSLYVPVAGDYRRGTVMLPLNTLEAGEHTLVLRAWDLYNNSSVATITFVVEPGLLPEVMDFSVKGTPVMSGKTTELVITHNRPQSEIDVVVELFSVQGQMMWKNVERVVCDGMEYRYSWDGDASGNRSLSTGIYVLRAYVISENAMSEPKNRKIVVVNNKK